MSRGRWLALFVPLQLAACAGASGAGVRPEHARVDPVEVLADVGASSSVVLRRPERSIEELEAARRDARGRARREAMRDLVVAYLFAAEDAEGREARRIRRRAERLADAAASGNRDEALGAEIAFTRLWMSFRAGASSAAQRAERFTTRYNESGDLLTLAWMIRGEIALAAEQWDDALTAFRFALGHLEHPLYAYALWRSAAAYRGLGRGDDADQALAEVEQLGCSRDAGPNVLRVALAAASERGTAVRRDGDGQERPASCEVEAAGGESEGWRPEE